LQLVPQPAPQPAVAEAARAAQLHLLELDGDRIRRPRRQRTIVGKQTQLAILAAVLVKDLERLTPGFLLAVVDLAQIQNLPLRARPRAGAAILHHAEVAMGLAILAAFVLAQEHGLRLSQFGHRPFKRVGLHHTALNLPTRAAKR
jgi:hypothetical protein